MILAHWGYGTGVHCRYERKGSAMHVLLFASQTTESGERLKHSIEGLQSVESLTHCWNISELLHLLQTPDPLPEAVVLHASSKHELRLLESFRFRLEQVFFILVLPNAEAETVARGHQLRPRFIVYQDSDFNEVSAVLDRLEARHGGHGYGSSPRGTMGCQKSSTNRKDVRK
jgi:hypothetical protein